MHLKQITFKNIAPFGDLNIELQENQLIIFSGINGRGKTTILSYIADAFFEISKMCGYTDIFVDNTKYYRVISASAIMPNEKYSIVYLNFIFNNCQYDYLEISGEADEEEIKKIIPSISDVQVKNAISILKNRQSYKGIHGDAEKIRNIFSTNILTYFPSDRCETPWWLNETEYKKNRLNTKIKFSEQLNKNIEARTLSTDVVNWILDVVLDVSASSIAHENNLIRGDQYSSMMYNSINQILQKILSNKSEACRFGVGNRQQGQARVSIVEETTNGIKMISPSIFHLSSGEIGLLVMFCEILKQYDQYPQDNIFNFKNISGIVLIDEIDKHLHMKLQKEILPELISLFPNIQFIVSSHAPFFSLGAASTLNNRTKFIDLTIGGKEIILWEIDELNELYQDIINGNENYKKLYDELQLENLTNKKLRILTEGYNTKYIEQAINNLCPDLSDKIIICNGLENKSGKSQLLKLYEAFLKTGVYAKTLFIWDCDAHNEITRIEESDSVYKFCFAQNKSNTIHTTGIENLFPEEFFTEKYHKKSTTKKPGGILQTNIEFDKTLFYADIETITDNEVFKLFAPLINKIHMCLELIDKIN